MENQSRHTIGVVMLMMGLLFSTCKKQNIPGAGETATLNIVNALPTSAPLIPVQGTTGPYLTPTSPNYGYYQNFYGAPNFSYGNSFLIGPKAGALQLYLVQRTGDTMVTHGHVSKYMFNQALALPVNSVHSLFIMGHDTSSADYLFVEDNLPVHQDSTAGVRFVNLSTSSEPISVDILGQPNGSEVQSLAYK